MKLELATAFRRDISDWPEAPDTNKYAPREQHGGTGARKKRTVPQLAL
jgi:hypothetical protein